MGGGVFNSSMYNFVKRPNYFCDVFKDSNTISAHCNAMYSAIT